MHRGARRSIQKKNGKEEVACSIHAVGTKKNYVLKVNGNSMLNKGIVDGDKAIIEYCNDADNGDIVVALINDNEVTLKKLKKEKDKIHLVPENDNYKVQSFNSDEVKIQGKLKGIIEYCDDPIVSVDLVHNAASCIFDSQITMIVDDGLVKICGWYDNEWGYSNRCVDLIERFSEI